MSQLILISVFASVQHRLPYMPMPMRTLQSYRVPHVVLSEENPALLCIASIDLTHGVYISIMNHVRYSLFAKITERLLASTLARSQKLHLATRANA